MIAPQSLDPVKISAIKGIRSRDQSASLPPPQRHKRRLLDSPEYPAESSPEFSVESSDDIDSHPLSNMPSSFFEREDRATLPAVKTTSLDGSATSLLQRRRSDLDIEADRVRLGLRRFERSRSVLSMTDQQFTKESKKRRFTKFTSSSSKSDDDDEYVAEPIAKRFKRVSNPELESANESGKKLYLPSTQINLNMKMIV